MQPHIIPLRNRNAFFKNSSIFEVQYLKFFFPARLHTVHMLAPIKIEEQWKGILPSVFLKNTFIHLDCQGALGSWSLCRKDRKAALTHVTDTHQTGPLIQVGSDLGGSKSSLLAGINCILNNISPMLGSFRTLLINFLQFQCKHL